MLCAWQLKMAGPIPGELAARIRHNTARGHDKHGTGRRGSGRDSELPRVHPLRPLFSTLNHITDLHPSPVSLQCPGGQL